MITREGIPVSPGVAIAEALILDKQRFRIPRRYVSRDAVDDELQRLKQAIEAVSAEVDRNRVVITEQLGEQYGAIFSAHLQLLRDPRLNSEWAALIREHQNSPEHAVSTTLLRYASVFEKLGNRYLAERSHDIFDIERSLLSSLLGLRRGELEHINSVTVVLAHDLTPSETASFDRRFVLGFATEAGGAVGHAAIVARGMEIPAVVGVGPFLADIAPGDMVIIDGEQGQVVIRPDETTLDRYRQQLERRRTAAASLEQLRDLPAETKDGQRIEIFANIEFPHEAAAVRQRGAQGIGLYRTEFLYLGREQDPDEEDHYQAYAEVLEKMEGQPVIIRTFDLGADKLGQAPTTSEERNPFLGLRSIRLSLRNVPSFRRQLTAILRASALGDLRVMFPMITTLSELRQAKSLLADTLAVDRSNREVAALYHDSDPAVLRLIQMTLEAAARRQKPVSLCGQMCANPLYITLLVGLGLRSLSVPPAVIPEIKQVCRSVSIAQCGEIARRAMQLQSAREIDNFLREELKRIRC
jgi:phosphotransferase system enzyme I (PtsI)